MAGAAKKELKEPEGRESYYHYTDAKGAKGIKESGVIKGSSRQRGDAAFGDGAYFTTRPPTDSKFDIAENNWDMRTNRGVVQDIVKSGNYKLCSVLVSLVCIAI